jgi:FkbH-like protein
MDTADFLFPHDLAVTGTGIRKVLLIGSCMAEAYLDHFKAAAPEVHFDWLLYNNPAELPEMSEAAAQAYDFQYVQLSLRHVVRDEVVDFGGFLAEDMAEAILDRGRKLMRLMVEMALKYNRAHGMLTFVANFMVPQVPVVAALDQVGSQRDFRVLVQRLNEELALLVAQYSNAFVADADAVGSTLGKRWFLDDVVGFYAHGGYWGAQNHAFDTEPAHNAPAGGRIDPLLPMDQIYGSRADDMFRALWRQVEAMCRAIRQIDMVKLVIFDLDDTLWRGQIAEHYGEGVAPPVWHGWPTGIWEAVQHLRARGIITALCSKNEESLVRTRWGRAVLPWLTLDDFPLRTINWRPKAENVSEIIRLASVTPRSTVFVDDNPVERESVRAALPGIRVLGSNPNTTRRILLWSPETQIATRSTESANREQSIRKMQQRESDRTAMSREEFLAELGCAAALSEIGSANDPDFARAFELLNKTNQFNTTGIRWTHAQIAAFFGIGGQIVAFRVKDRYTDYGLAGTVLRRGGMFAQFAMSCRVLGLEIETSVIWEIMRAAAARDPGVVFSGRVMETDANMVCRDIFLRCGFAPTPAEQTLFIWPGQAIPPAARHLAIERRGLVEPVGAADGRVGSQAAALLVNDAA